MARSAIVRQELVTRQLVPHLPPAGFRELDLLDSGGGQGIQASALARLGHHVVGVDLSEKLLDLARQAVADEPADVHSRLSFARADLLDLGGDYLPSLEATVAALVAAARPGGLVSLLTKNQAGLAMRAGMSGDWPGTLAAFDASHYSNRVGIDEVRAELPSEVQAAFLDIGSVVVAWYRVRLLSDQWGTTEPAADFAGLLAAEEEARPRYPYRALSALTHTAARTHDTRRQ